MKTFLLGLILTTSVSSAFAYSPEGYPGYLWSSESYNFNGLEGFGTMGNLNQGIRWFTLPGGIVTTTYAAYRWRLREKNHAFFNAHGPATGLQFTFDVFNFGGDYEWQRYSALGTSTKNFSLFVNWYKRVYLIGGGNGDGASLFGIPVLGFPTTTWGRVTKDFNHLEGLGSMGFVNQGIEWFKLPGGIVTRTLASYQWRFRTENKAFYNVHGPGVGVEFTYKSFDFGTQYIWLKYPDIRRNSHDFRIYLSFYLDWDFKKSGG